MTLPRLVIRICFDRLKEGLSSPKKRPMETLHQKKSDNDLSFFGPIHLPAQKSCDRNFIANHMIIGLSIVSILVIVFFSLSVAAKAKERAIENSVLAVAQEMTSAFQRVEDYTCDVETIYYATS